jgi:hypothetical protein
MFKGTFAMSDGRKALIIGVSQENIDRLRRGTVIHFAADAVGILPGQEIGAVTIFYGPTEEKIEQWLREGGLIGPETIVVGKDPVSES